MPPPEVTKGDINRLYDKLDESTRAVTILTERIEHVVTEKVCLETQQKLLKDFSKMLKQNRSNGSSGSSERWWLRLIVGIGTVALAGVGVFVLASKAIGVFLKGSH